ncbi:uncharacterized protein J4E79_003248 [Alternaria viburni]|uniref:uncharacterized protein n=1 Tax=Alternaria viburni TaxID=566460 RepID=UPI0020C5A6A9|nr:uncharacterized protein J4E79_003248 [Alternaria viburni]KAI4664949.1 hypothetical protein J4E79_003248 [Alternaria viburni]
MRLRARSFDSASDKCDVDPERDDALLRMSPDADDDIPSPILDNDILSPISDDDILSRSSDEDTICVVVGKEPNKSKFFMDPRRICHCSKFFRNALRGGWKSAQNLKVTLKEEDPRIFAWYLDTLYNGTKLSFQGQPWSFQPMSELYVLAEMLMDDSTKKNILAAIQKRCESPHFGHSLPEPSAVRTIYDGTPESSPARRLMVDIFSQRAIKERIEHWTTENLPKDFLLDLSVNLIAQRPLPDDDNRGHDEGKNAKKRAAEESDDELALYLDSLESPPKVKKRLKLRVGGRDSLAFLDQYSAVADAHSGNTKTKVALGSQHDTAYIRAERTAEWQTNISNLQGGRPLKPQIMTDDGRSWFETT